MMVALPNHPSGPQVHNAARGLADVYGLDAKPQSVCLDTFLDEDTEFIQFLEAIQADDDTRQREQRPGYTATAPTFCTSSSVQHMEPMTSLFMGKPFSRDPVSSAPILPVHNNPLEPPLAPPLEAPYCHRPYAQKPAPILHPSNPPLFHTTPPASPRPPYTAPPCQAPPHTPPGTPMEVSPPGSPPFRPAHSYPTLKPPQVSKPSINPGVGTHGSTSNKFSGFHDTVTAQLQQQNFLEDLSVQLTRPLSQQSMPTQAMGPHPNHADSVRSITPMQFMHPTNPIHASQSDRTALNPPQSGSTERTSITSIPAGYSGSRHANHEPRPFIVPKRQFRPRGGVKTRKSSKEEQQWERTVGKGQQEADSQHFSVLSGPLKRPRDRLVYDERETQHNTGSAYSDLLSQGTVSRAEGRIEGKNMFGARFPATDLSPRGRGRFDRSAAAAKAAAAAADASAVTTAGTPVRGLDSEKRTVFCFPDRRQESKEARKARLLREKNRRNQQAFRDRCKVEIQELKASIQVAQQKIKHRSDESKALAREKEALQHRVRFIEDKPVLAGDASLKSWIMEQLWEPDAKEDTASQKPNAVLSENTTAELRNPDSTMETGEAQKDTLTRNCRQKNTQSHCADSKHHQLIPCSLFQVSGESDKESGTSDIDELLKKIEQHQKAWEAEHPFKKDDTTNSVSWYIQLPHTPAAPVSAYYKEPADSPANVALHVSTRVRSAACMNSLVLNYLAVILECSFLVADKAQLTGTTAPFYSVMNNQSAQTPDVQEAVEKLSQNSINECAERLQVQAGVNSTASAFGVVKQVLGGLMEHYRKRLLYSTWRNVCMKCMHALITRIQSYHSRNTQQSARDHASSHDETEPKLEGRAEGSTGFKEDDKAICAMQCVMLITMHDSLYRVTTHDEVVADVMTQHDVNQRLHELMSATMPIWQLLMKAAPIRMMQCMRAMHGVINSKQEKELVDSIQSSLQFTSEQRQCMASWWLGGLRQKSQAAEGFKSAIRKIHKLVESSQTEVQEHQKFLEHVGVQEDPVTEIVAGKGGMKKDESDSGADVSTTSAFTVRTTSQTCTPTESGGNTNALMQVQDHGGGGKADVKCVANHTTVRMEEVPSDQLCEDTALTNLEFWNSLPKTAEIEGDNTSEQCSPGSVYEVLKYIDKSVNVDSYACGSCIEMLRKTDLPAINGNAMHAVHAALQEIRDVDNSMFRVHTDFHSPFSVLTQVQKGKLFAAQASVAVSWMNTLQRIARQAHDSS